MKRASEKAICMHKNARVDGRSQREVHNELPWALRAKSTLPPITCVVFTLFTTRRNDTMYFAGRVIMFSCSSANNGTQQRGPLTRTSEYSWGDETLHARLPCCIHFQTSEILWLFLHRHLVSRQMVKPPFHLLLHCALDRTSIHLCNSLSLQNTLHPRGAARMEHATIVHRTL